MEEVEAATDDVPAEAQPEAAAEKLLPMRLSPFAPPDKLSEERTSDRLRNMSFSELRSRSGRIDKRLHELGLSVGEPALTIPSVRGTGLIDLDRILRKIDGLEQAHERVRMEREVDNPDPGIVGKNLAWLSDVFRARKIHARRNLLVSELGLALCASDQRALGEYAVHVKRLMEEHVPTARRIDELFVEMRLVDDELDRRRQQGLTGDPPKEIDLVLARALDSVDDVSSKVGTKVAELGKSAAKTAAKTAVTGGGQAIVGIAKAGWALGGAAITKLREDGDPEQEGAPGIEHTEVEVLSARALPAPTRAPSADAGIPELIRKLARLRHEGILTEDEFATKKQELLDRL